MGFSYCHHQNVEIEPQNRPRLLSSRSWIAPVLKSLGHGLGDREILLDFRQEQKAPKLPLGPTQPRTQWVMEELTTRLHVMLRLRVNGARSPLLHTTSFCAQE